MPKLIKYQFKLYKRFELDVWGLLNSNPVFGHPVVRFFQDSYRYRAERAKQRFRQFIYRIDVINPDKSYKRKKWKFVSMQLVKLFYKGISQRRVYKFSKLSSASFGLWVDNFLLLIESRISTILYRVNWIPNILFLNQFLAHGGILIDSKVPTTVNFMVKMFQLIRPLPSIQSKLRFNFHLRLINNMVYFNTPRYIFMNSKIMFACIFRNPSLSDISFPVLLDIYRLNDMN
jgi:hypothetical protein